MPGAYGPLATIRRDIKTRKRLIEREQTILNDLEQAEKLLSHNKVRLHPQRRRRSRRAA